jgi:hypothetical protein
MIKVVFICFIGLFLVTCTPKELPTVLQLNDGDVIMKVSHQTSEEELKTIQKQLLTIQITIDFSTSEFFENGMLRKLNLVVMTPDSHVGKTSADIVNLQYKYFGFIYQKNGSPTFKIGEI